MHVREGDVLLIGKLDRLGRSLWHLRTVVTALAQRTALTPRFRAQVTAISRPPAQRPLLAAEIMPPYRPSSPRRPAPRRQPTHIFFVCGVICVTIRYD